MAEDRYEREERYGRRHRDTRENADAGQRPSDWRNRSFGDNEYADHFDDYDRGAPSGWRTDGLDYPQSIGRYHGRDRLADRGGYHSRQERYGRERDFLDRAGDEVASWLGDEDAVLRRRADQYRGKGPKGYTRSDERIREDVNDRLTDDPWLDASDIDVAVAIGEVTLTGEVLSRQDKRRAEDCAEMVSGVTHVQNNLRVRSAATAVTAPLGKTP